MNARTDKDGPRWWERAACRGTDPEMFFPPPCAAPPRVAKRICAGCPVRAKCLEYALANGERHGIWGGLSANERAILKTRLTILARLEPEKEPVS